MPQVQKDSTRTSNPSYFEGAMTPEQYIKKVEKNPRADSRRREIEKRAEAIQKQFGRRY